MLDVDVDVFIQGYTCIETKKGTTIFNVKLGL